MFQMFSDFFAMFSSLFRSVDKLARSGEALSDYALENSEMLRDRSKISNSAERLRLTEELSKL